MELSVRIVPFYHIIKFHKVPELFPNRKVHIVRTEQLCLKQHLLHVLKF